jgi:hypothetical protein
MSRRDYGDLLVWGRGCHGEADQIGTGVKAGERGAEA